MFKKILTFTAIATIAFSSISCSEENPSVEFDRTIYVLSDSKTIDIVVNLSEPASSDVNIPLNFSGSAALGSEYTVSAQQATVKAGSSSGSITLTNESIPAEKQVVIALTAPSGYKLGAKSQTVITIDPQELLICSFSTQKDNALGSYTVKINVTGAVSGSSFNSPSDLVIPLTVSGDGASSVVFDGGKAEAVLKAGERTAKASFSLAEGFEVGSSVTIGIATENTRYVLGNNDKIELTLYNAEMPDEILGTWKFSKVFALDEVLLWFEEMEDDPELLPVHNDGFTLIFSKDDSGNVIVTPDGKGDFANFFRTATVTRTTPINISSEGEITGENTVLEINMFMAEDGYDVHTTSYYKLSSANRAFSSSKETLGEAVIIFTLIKDGLQVEFRDYDTPPFGEMWWDDDFDPDMFGFASLFEKQ